MRACPNAPNSGVGICCEVIARVDDTLLCTCRVSFIHVALQTEPLGCVVRFRSDSEGGVGEWPISNAVIGTGAIATKACVWIEDRGIDIVACILGLVPPTSTCISGRYGAWDKATVSYERHRASVVALSAHKVFMSLHEEPVPRQKLTLTPMY